MDLVQSLINEPEKRLQTLKEIRARVIAKSDTVMIGNLKKLILGLKASLIPISNLNQSEVEYIQEETLKILEQLIYKNDPDLEVHIGLILSNLIGLFETSNHVLRDQNLKCIQVYCEVTNNVEAILNLMLKNGIENANPHLRHQCVKYVPQVIQFDKTQSVVQTIEFFKIIESLLLRAKGDNIDSIRVQAQTSLREILNQFQEYLPDIHNRLKPQQKQQLTELLSVQQEVSAINQAVQNQLQIQQRDRNLQEQAIPQISNLFAFGSLPLNMIQHIQQHSDWKIKLRVVEDLEKFIYEMSLQQKQQFMHYCSSFITFVEQFLINDDNMKIVLGGIRILKYLMKNAQMAEKTNLTKLIHSLIMKMNDPKEIIRQEIEQLFHMKTKSLILNLLHLFKTYRVSNDAKEEDNLFMQLVEPLSYLFTNKEEPLKVRYLAQETLALMATKLQRTQILEALYECLADDKTLYDKFCDRLDTQHIPFLSKVDDIQRLEFPLPTNHVYSVQNEQKVIVQQKQQKPPSRSIQAADQYFSQDFTDNISETDFQPYNQVVKDISVSNSQQSQRKFQNKQKEFESQEDFMVTKETKQKTLAAPRRVFQGLGQDIISSNKFKLPQNETNSLAKDQMEEFIHINDNRNATPIQISEKLRLLKSTGRFNSPPNGSRFPQNFQNTNFDQNFDQENSTQSSFNPPLKSQNLKIQIKKPLIAKSERVPNDNEKQKLNSKIDLNQSQLESSPKFFARNIHQEVDYMDQTPNIYSNKYVNKVEYQNNGVAEQLFSSDTLKAPNMRKQTSDLANLRSSLRMSTNEMMLPYEGLQPLENPQKDISAAFQNLSSNFNLVNHQTLQMKIGKSKTLEFCKQDKLQNTIKKSSTIGEAYMSLQRQLDQDVDATLNLLLKKSSDTNSFIADTAKSTLETVSVNISEQRLMQNIIQNSDSKSDKIRSSVAVCIAYIIQNMGQKLLQFKDTGKLMTIISAYINDSSSDVRQNIKIAILKLEQNNQPFSRDESEQFIKKYVQKEFDQTKILKILEQGANGIMMNSSQIGLNNSIASMRMKSQSSYMDETLMASPVKNRGKEQSNNFRKVFKPNIDEENISIQVQDQQPAKSQQSNRTNVRASPIQQQPQKQQLIQQIDKTQVNYNDLKNPQASEEITQVLSLLMKQTGEQKKYALLNLAESSVKQKQLLIQNELFYPALEQVVLKPLEELYGNQIGSKTSLSPTLQEAEVLHNLLAEIQDRLDIILILKIVAGISPYVGSSNSQAKKNAENLINKITSLYQAHDIAIAFAESIQNSGAKTKLYLTEKLINMIPQINKQSPPKLQTDVFPAVYRLMEEYTAARGRNLSQELKNSIEKIVKVSYYEQGSEFVELCPSKLLSKVFEIVNKEKRALM
eukprot:403346170